MILFRTYFIIMLFFSPIFSKELSMNTKDGYTLKAWLIFPKQQKIAYPLAVIAHQFGSNHTGWIRFASFLRHKGFATLNMDLRGHGLSIYKDKKIDKIIMYTSMDNLQSSITKSEKKVGFKHISHDISMWINYVQKQYPQKIKHNDISFFGASLGAGALVGLMFDYQPKIAILFSPGSAQQCGSEDTIADTTTKIMLISSQHDFAQHRTLHYAKEAVNPTVLILPGGGHGEALMKQAKQYVDFFINKNDK